MQNDECVEEPGSGLFELPLELLFDIARFIPPNAVGNFMLASRSCRDLIQSVAKLLQNIFLRYCTYYIIPRRQNILVKLTKDGHNWIEREQQLTKQRFSTEIHKLSYTHFEGTIYVAYILKNSLDRIYVDFSTRPGFWEYLTTVFINNSKPLLDLKLTHFNSQLLLGFIGQENTLHLFSIDNHGEKKYRSVESPPNLPLIKRFDLLQYEKTLYLSYAQKDSNGNIRLMTTEGECKWNGPYNTSYGTHESLSFCVFQNRLFLNHIHTRLRGIETGRVSQSRLQGLGHVVEDDMLSHEGIVTRSWRDTKLMIMYIRRGNEMRVISKQACSADPNLVAGDYWE